MSAAGFRSRRRALSVLAQVPILLSALEELSPAGRRTQDGLLTWKVVKTRYPSLEDSAAAAAFFSPRADRAASVVCLVTSVSLMAVRPGTRASVVLEVVQIAAHIRQHWRMGGYGRDGSDHALVVEHAMLLASNAAENTPAVRDTAIAYVGLQGVLSYLVSGAVKLISPVWRHGVAFGDTLRTVSYGDEKMFRFLRERPLLRRLGAWTVIAAETMFPLILIVPAPLARLGSAAMLGLHAGIARYMGLNRFFWGFAALHPGIDELRVRVQDVRARRKVDRS